MNATQIMQVVDTIHRDKHIDKEIVFQAIESALVSASKKYHGEEADIGITIDRVNGKISGHVNGVPIDPEAAIGRIGAQTAKQVIMQKIREAERDAVFNEFDEQKDQMVNGIVQRTEGGTTTVLLNGIEAILPKSEQIPGETHHANERVRAVVAEVRKQNNRVKVVLSRSRPALVQRLFEQEIPEISEGVISVKAMAREPGYRSKVAVSSSDQRVDCVGACVGVRGNRIKNIVDELAGERIDIVRWNDDMPTLIPNALQPAEVDEVILCKELGRAIVLVREDQLSLAIGRRGQNVRLASKLCGWDIEIMTREELEEQIDRAVSGFSELDGVAPELAERLVVEGFLSYDDLSVIEPTTLMAFGGIDEEAALHITEQAEAKAQEAEAAAAQERRKQKEQERIEKATKEAEAAEAAAKAAAAPAAGLASDIPLGEVPTETEVAPAADGSAEAATEAAPASEASGSETSDTTSPQG
jgi:N utilization substance protein A